MTNDIAWRSQGFANTIADPLNDPNKYGLTPNASATPGLTQQPDSYLIWNDLHYMQNNMSPGPSNTLNPALTFSLAFQDFEKRVHAQPQNDELQELLIRMESALPNNVNIPGNGLGHEFTAAALATTSPPTLPNMISDLSKKVSALGDYNIIPVNGPSPGSTNNYIAIDSKTHCAYIYDGNGNPVNVSPNVTVKNQLQDGCSYILRDGTRIDCYNQRYSEYLNITSGKNGYQGVWSAGNSFTETFPNPLTILTDRITAMPKGSVYGQTTQGDFAQLTNGAWPAAVAVSPAVAAATAVPQINPDDIINIDAAATPAPK